MKRNYKFWFIMVATLVLAVIAVAMPPPAENATTGPTANFMVPVTPKDQSSFESASTAGTYEELSAFALAAAQSPLNPEALIADTPAQSKGQSATCYIRTKRPPRLVVPTKELLKSGKTENIVDSAIAFAAPTIGSANAGQPFTPPNEAIFRYDGPKGYRLWRITSLYEKENMASRRRPFYNEGSGSGGPSA